MDTGGDKGYRGSGGDKLKGYSGYRGVTRGTGGDKGYRVVTGDTGGDKGYRG